MTIRRRSLHPRELDHEQLWVAVASAAGICALVAWARDVPVPRCTFKLLTGLPCPTCGAARALRALASLDPGAALALNPLVTVAILAVAGYLVYAAFVVVTRSPRVRVQLGSRDWVAIRIASAVLLTCNWVYLIAADR
jgi:Protein of unknown function (DUF2752)